MRTITIEKYRTDPIDRALAKGVMAQAGVSPDDVTAVDVYVDRFVIHCTRHRVIDGEIDTYQVEVLR